MQRNKIPAPESAKVITAHIISHNHWDREWIFTAKYVNRWIPPFMNNLIKMLEEQPAYKFVLDGQTLILEDYFAQLTPVEARTVRRKIKKFVAEGRLMVGPAYLQPDWGLVSSESLVRNLLIGFRMGKKLGGVMKAGWMLDNFGQIAQAPQIYKGFGIEGAFVWRGVEMKPEEIKSEFWWEAPDGSRILGIYLLDSYRNAMVLSLTKEIALERIIAHTRVLAPLASTPNVLLMNGYEQVPWPDDVLPIIEQFNREHRDGVRCVQSTPEEYLESIRRHDPELPVLQGYFYSGKYMPILKGVFSSRSKLKQANNRCQRELERWAEPFATLAWVFGSEYPREKLEKPWKILLLNHTHDDVCGCNIDVIARDMKDRFTEVYGRANDIAQNSFKAIARMANTTRFPNAVPIIVFNPSPRLREQIIGLSVELPAGLESFSIKDSEGRAVGYQLAGREEERTDMYLFAGDVPSLGYKTFYITPGEPEAVDAQEVHISEQDFTMENRFMQVRVNPNGTLDVRHKQTGRTYQNLGYFEDGGDCGDTYDYSHPQQDLLVTSLDANAEISVVESGPYLARFRVELHLRLPKSLTADRRGRSAELADYPIVYYVTLTAVSRRVEVRTFLRNNVKDHRLRLLFPTGIQADHSYTEAPFDIARFLIEDEPVSDEIPEKLRQLMLAGRYTAPINTRILQNFVGLNDGTAGLTVISSRLNEYEILKEQNTIALTLVRSVGWLARQDLLTRVGDVGPHIFTPEAQELGDHSFSYSIYPNAGGWLEAKPHTESEAQNLKFRAVVTDVHRGHLPEAFSFLAWEDGTAPAAMRLSAVKRAEDASGIIIRFYNTHEQEARGRLRVNGKTLKVYKTNLAEESAEELPLQDGCVAVQARGKEIITLKVSLELQEPLNGRPSGATRMALPLVIDPHLPPVEMPPVVTLQEVEAEIDRSRGLENMLQESRNLAYRLEDEIERKASRDLEKLAELQRVRTLVATLTRQHYESRVSALLNEQLYWISQLESQLEEIGEELCWARTKKRVFEYLSNYYEKQLQKKGGLS